MEISIETIKKVKGIGNKTLQRILEQHNKDMQDKEFVSKYDRDIHIPDNTTISGDCIVEMNGIKDNSIDMILVDLPYGITQNKWDSEINLDHLWKHYERILKDSGIVIMFGQGKFFNNLIKAKEDWFKYDLVWEKNRPTGFLNANRMPLRIHEQIGVFYKMLPTYNPQKWLGDKPSNTKGISYQTKESKNNIYGNFEVLETHDTLLKNPRSILKFSRPHPPIHPTQKPIDLLEYLIKTYTNENDLVLDNTMGSGSTCVACVNTNRKYIGIEHDIDYYNMANERIQKSVIDKYGNKLNI